MLIKEPAPLTQWQTSDGRIHSTQEIARRHEVFLSVCHALPNHTDRKAAHSIICALASKYDFVERTEPTQEAN